MALENARGSRANVRKSRSCAELELRRKPGR
jgi:hypothetical protein